MPEINDPVATPPPQPVTVTPTAGADEAALYRPVASYLHTGLIVLLMAAVATVSALRHSAPPIPGEGPTASYVTTLIWQWGLFALILLGVRRHGSSLADLLGKQWRAFDDVLMDVVYVAGFFVISKLILAVIVVTALKVLQLPDDTFSLKKSMEAVGSLTPRTALDIFIWIGLSITAGFVEEVVFRGYLQRQIMALTRNVAAGILISALIFGSAHAYQGFLQVTIITALGAMFGILAYWRKSLKPGIIAHAGQDIFSGLALSWLSRHPLT